MSTRNAGFDMVSGCCRSISTGEEPSQHSLPLLTVVHIADSMLEPCAVPSAERLRQAFIGYDNLPDHIERQPLRLYVCNSRGKLRVSVNEFQTLVNRLPIATVNADARSHAANFCRTQVKDIDLFYVIDAHDEPNESTRDEILEHVFVQATTVRVNTVWDENDGYGAIFGSAEHLVDIVSRVFGTCVERIVFNSWVESHYTLEEIYWPHTVQTVELGWLGVDPIFIDDPDHDTFDLFMTPERVAYVKRELYSSDNHDNLVLLSRHLLKFHEILDVSKMKLPGLQGIDLELHTYIGGIVRSTRIKATIKEGDLWVNWNDVHIGFDHDFVEMFGDRWGKFFAELLRQMRLRYTA
ncbi:hypothetical protein K505DRAFT_388891 [Melanomma pulvis-pyrius CBS 109.77]|uniref:Uncharacterized protein n=1 Tax=Melanomma pulvis-pyrius CBS 109.77 TaxID=1314802 RepID=A0A6A6X5J5_9PLEO|nr:hypothetical protein K505DRAFT_388891 [Melanomma pulvis-pyrius CBS 109.77]